MDKFLELGIINDDLNLIFEQFPQVMNISVEEINEKINILKYLECDDEQIKNIIVRNPRYLNRLTEDVLETISYLKKIGLDDLNLLFDTNPYFLNYDVFEIRDYINKQVKLGKDIENIVDEIDSNPYAIDYE